MNLACSSETYTIPSGGGIDITVTGIFKLTAVVMRLANSAANVYTVTLTRGVDTFVLFSHTATFQDIAWLLEGGGIVLKPQDVLRFANTAAEVGRVFFSYEMAGPLGPTIVVTPGPVADDSAGPLA